MPRQVVITTGARLHFGPLSYAPNSPRYFGGIGAMIDSPGFVVAVSASDRDEVLGPEAAAARARQTVITYRDRCPAERQPPLCRIEVRAEIPGHVGLGSGTQLAMAIGEALALLAGESRIDVTSVAQRVGRGAKSAVGIHGFTRGGFLVDAGRRSAASIGTLAARAEIPHFWRFLLVAPPLVEGLSGTAESIAFSRLSPMPESTTKRLCRIALTQILPGFIEMDFGACVTGLFEYGRLVGEYFAPAQGGVYADPRMRALLEHLHDGRRIAGVGQTSWGPTVFVLTPMHDSAESLRDDLARDARWSDCRFHIAAPLNTGAAIEVG